jgi:hypothetical protein
MPNHANAALEPHAHLHQHGPSQNLAEPSLPQPDPNDQSSPPAARATRRKPFRLKDRTRSGAPGVSHRSSSGRGPSESPGLARTRAEGVPARRSAPGHIGGSFVPAGHRVFAGPGFGIAKVSARDEETSPSGVRGLRPHLPDPPGCPDGSWPPGPMLNVPGCTVMRPGSTARS